MRFGTLFLLVLACSAMPLMGDVHASGTIARHGDELVIGSAADSARVTFSIDPARDAKSGKLSVRSLDDGSLWSIALTPADLGGAARTLVLPAGGYEVVAEVERHRPAAKELRVNASAKQALGALRLPATPVLRGVVRANGKPLAGARIELLPAGKGIVTDAAGAFSIAENAWPVALRVSRKGYGTKLVPIDGTEVDTTLQPIDLGAGATVRVQFVRGGYRGPLEVAIATRTDQGEPEWLATEKLAANESVAVFSDLDAGSYVVLTAGAEPLQRLTGIAVVGAGNDRTVKIEPRNGIARGRFTLGGKPLKNADITLVREGLRWTTGLRTDESGEFSSQVWERGEYDVAVRTSSVRVSYAGVLRVPDGAVLALAMDIPDRMVRGRVTASGAPVANATVILRAPDVGASRRSTTDAFGNFEFAAVQPGSYALNATASSFLRSEPATIVVAESDRRREVPIAMKTSHPRVIEVVDGRGIARGGATVVCAVGASIRSTAMTDVHGRATLGTPVDEESRVYVFPREGSIAIQTIPAAKSKSAIRVVVPPATASLEVQTRTTDGAAMPEVKLLVRFNGEVIPPEVATERQRAQGGDVQTNHDGIARMTAIPAGVYEVWPYRSSGEVEALLASSSALAAPVNINVRSGHNTATLRFRKR